MGNRLPIDARFLAHLAARRLVGRLARIDVPFRKDPLGRLLLSCDQEDARLPVHTVEDDPWASIETLVEDGPSAFTTAARSACDVTDDLMAGAPASLYLRGISGTPLLTAAEEVTLAQELEAGKAARARLEQGVENEAERDSLDEVVARGDAARIRLIESNLRLVVSVARK